MAMWNTAGSVSDWLRAWCAEARRNDDVVELLQRIAAAFDFDDRRAARAA